MTQTELLDWVRTELNARAQPEVRDGMTWYFKGTIDCYGVKAPVVQELARQAYRTVKPWPVAQRNAFCNALWKSGRLEEGATVIYLYRRFRKQCGVAEFEVFEKWIDRYVTNWANCDGVSSWLLAASIENEPELAERVLGWTSSPNRWKRRAAAVSLLWEGKKGRHMGEILCVAQALHTDSDDMVQKGVGWLLKETYVSDPERITTWLEQRRKETPRLLLRYAAEKMSVAHRARVLAR